MPRRMRLRLCARAGSNGAPCCSGCSTDAVIGADDAQVTERRFAAGSSAQHPLVRLGNAGLTHAKTGRALDIEALTEWLAKRAGLPYQRIDPLKVDVGRVTEVMSITYAEAHRALPLLVGNQEVTVATCEPFDTHWVAEIEAHTKRRIKLAVSNPIELQRYTTEFYTLARSVRAAQKSGEAASSASFEQLVELGRTNKQLDANDQGVVQVVDWLWQYAFDQRASDIHLEPRRDMGAIRFRIDGVLHTVYQLPMGVMNAMTARIKLLGRMDVVERRRPQDGRIKTRGPGTTTTRGDEVEMRLSTIPTAFGEKMVMRIFDPDTTVKSLDALGFSAHDSQRWGELVAKPNGIILVTGPTGSGKTTTLYSTLKRLATDEVNVCTIEDPIEMIEPAFNQTQVQPALDLGFAEGLRSLMRQDPDIIMVGEIRDLETAEMAIQAALTGHLVFSTLHTNDAASAITRLDRPRRPAVPDQRDGRRRARAAPRAHVVPGVQAARRGDHARDARRSRSALAHERGLSAVQAGRLPRMPHDRLSRARRPVRAAAAQRAGEGGGASGARRVAPAAAVGERWLAAIAACRRDEGRRRGDDARRSAAQYAGVGVIVLARMAPAYDESKSTFASMRSQGLP